CIYFAGGGGLVMRYLISPMRVFSVPKLALTILSHNLPALENISDFYYVTFTRFVADPDLVVIVRGDKLRFALSAISTSAAYKILAVKVSGGIAEGVWWVDNYVYDPGQVNIEFTSQGQSSGSGDPKSFTGRTTVNKAPVSRTVIAVGIDGEAPVFLAQTQSNENTGQ